ncbi:MAG: hypothetical protein GY936_00025 [Ignavibacteriae bacterium]|nr:hypothetical protein [Ignavibacteriota bacterium]
MMETTYLIGLLNLIILGVLWFFFFRHYFVDAHRNYLFDLRNKLFDYAIEHDIPFDNPAFLDRWNSINAKINNTHHLHTFIITGLLQSFAPSNKLKKYIKSVDENLKALDKEHQIFFTKNYAEELKLFISYSLKSSILFFFVSSIILLGLLMKYVLENYNNSGWFGTKRKEIYDELTYWSLQTTV